MLGEFATSKSSLACYCYAMFQPRGMMTCLRAGTSSVESECGDTATGLASTRSGWRLDSLCTDQHIQALFTCQVYQCSVCDNDLNITWFIFSGYTAYAHNPLSSYSSLPQLSPPSYHQYSPSLGYVDNTAASPLSSFSSPSAASIRGHNPSSTEERSYPSQFNIF